MKLHHYLIIFITILSLPAGQVVADENLDQLTVIANGEHRSDANKSQEPVSESGKNP